MRHKRKNNYPYQKVLIILSRICSKMDCTLKLQLILKITITDLSFSVKLTLNFEYFDRLRYSPLYYSYTKQNSTEIEQFTATFCG